MAQLANAPIEVFISYSHRDDDLREEFVTHLANLRRQRKITAWHDRAIEAGEEWEAQIKEQLESARIILLLISPPFMASNYCYDIEMQRAMERHDAGTARVIPIILRPCDWKDSPFSKLQVLPKDAKPVTQWSNRDDAFLNVVQGIRKAVESFQMSGVSEQPPPILKKEPNRGETVAKRNLSAIFLIGLTGFSLVKLLSPELIRLGDEPKPILLGSNVEKNLVKNPGFEEEFAGWNQNNQNNAEHKLEVGHKSSKAACSIQQALSSMPNEWVGVRQENIGVKAGQEYRVEAFLFSEKAHSVHAKVKWFDQLNNLLDEQQLFVGPNGNSEGWVKKSSVVTAPKDAASATLFIWHGAEQNTPNSKLCIDDVVFEPTSTSKDAVIKRGGWWAEYYRGNFETKVASGEVPDQISWSGLHQNWTENKETAPSELEGEFDNFSVHLFAKRNLEPGKYLFTVMADDHIRVKFNNQEIIEGSFRQEKEYQLSGGEYNIVIDYKNDTGHAAILLNWKKIAN